MADTTITGSNLDDTITVFEKSRDAWSWGVVEDGFFQATGTHTLFEGFVKVSNEVETREFEIGAHWAGHPDRDGTADYHAVVQTGAGNDYIDAGDYDGLGGEEFSLHVDGGTGNDVVRLYNGHAAGGAGTDILDLSQVTTGVEIDYSGTETGSATLHNGNAITYAKDLEGIIATDHADKVTLGDTGGIAVTGLGNDTIIGGAGNDYIEAGVVNTGDYDEITTGDGWDIVYMGKLGNGSRDYANDLSHMTMWSALGVNPAAGSDAGSENDTFNALRETALWMGQDGNWAKLLKLMPGFGSKAADAGELADYLIRKAIEARIVPDSAPLENVENTQFAMIRDFDPRYDQVMTPILENDDVTDGYSDITLDGQDRAVLELNLSLGNGGTFAKLNLDDGFMAAFQADLAEMAAGGTYSEDVIRESLLKNLYDARVTLQKDGTSVVGELADQEAKGQAVETGQNLRDALDDAAETALAAGERMTIVGNMGGTYLEIDDTAPFVSGSAQNDVFTMVDETDASARQEYYVAGFEGDDMLTLSNDQQVVHFNGGAGLDVVSFTALKDRDTGAAVQGVTVDLSTSGYQTVTTDGMGKIALASVEGAEGTAGSDTISAGSTGGLLIGHGGDDSLIGGASADVLNGGAGRDTLDGKDGADTLYGAEGRDTLYGGDGHDHLDGGGDADYIDGGTGHDTIYGDDSYTYTNDTLIGGDGHDEIHGGNGTDRIYGGAGNDLLYGGDGVWDTVWGQEGDDVIWVTAGLTRVDGGTGSDAVTYDGLGHGQGAIRFDMNDTVAADWAEDGTAFRVDYSNDGWRHSFVSNVEHIVGSRFADHMTGDDNSTRFQGGWGADTIHAGGGHDTVEGGSGNNQLDGGAGNDLVLGGLDADTLKGGSGDDTLDGWISDDVIEGGAGNDLLRGGLHNDTLRGEADHDTLEGGMGWDALSGGSGNDSLDGGTNSDMLDGGSGNDTLRGGEGYDILTGGTGSDVFLFDHATGHDTITSFEFDVDTIQIDGYSAGEVSVSTSGSDTIFSFGGNTITVRGTGGGDAHWDTIYGSNSVSYVYDEGAALTGKVICTHLNKKGLIADDVYAWDSYYGKTHLSRTTVRGYHAWAVPFVTHVLRKSDLATRLVAPGARAWALEMAHRCDPVAFPKGTLTGKAILATCVPLCWALGKAIEFTESGLAMRLSHA